jgi:trimeric autotransporter adhesin
MAITPIATADSVGGMKTGADSDITVGPDGEGNTKYKDDLNFTETSTAVGAHAKATGDHSVALGDGSEASTPNTVSVGNSGIKRRITNVAEATSESDAVTFSQMKDAIGSISGGGSDLKPGDPHGKVGTAPVNGTATTYMRSDAAPAVDLNMSPRWAGKHIFYNDQSEQPAVTLSGTAVLDFDSATGTEDTKRWRIRAGDSGFSITTAINRTRPQAPQFAASGTNKDDQTYYDSFAPISFQRVGIAANVTLFGATSITTLVLTDNQTNQLQSIKAQESRRDGHDFYASGVLAATIRRDPTNPTDLVTKQFLGDETKALQHISIDNSPPNGSTFSEKGGISIGTDAGSVTEATIVIGVNALGDVNSPHSVAVGGAAAINQADSATAIGYGASVTNGAGSVALGSGSRATESNVVSLGGGTVAARRIVNVADGQHPSDAATCNQVSGLKKEMEDRFLGLQTQLNDLQRQYIVLLNKMEALKKE